MHLPDAPAGFWYTGNMIRCTPRAILKAVLWVWLLGGCSYQPSPATVLDDVCKVAENAAPADFQKEGDRQTLLAVKVACAAREAAETVLDGGSGNAR